METLFSTEDAAQWLGIQPNTLAKHRCKGTGPRFVRAGCGKQSPVRYRKKDLEGWLVEASSTSEPPSFEGREAERRVFSTVAPPRLGTREGST